MNEAETRAEYIDPQLKAAGWGVVEGSKVLREYEITAGRIQAGSKGKKMIADYVLVYQGTKLAVIEAKRAGLSVGEGVAQAKEYALKLALKTTYASNGKEIYQMCLETGKEELVSQYLSPEELWNKTFAVRNEWREKFAAVPYEDRSGTWALRFYQEIAVQRTMEAIANETPRILLTLATGTGKTAISFQIVWKLFQTRWNLNRDGARRPRILFLADRNILADQAFNAFSAFAEDALVRIKPDEIKKKGRVPTNGNIFFTIFQTFMSGTDKDGNPEPYFGDYAPDFFDFIVIDECHRGGAKDESSWRNILEYFAPAVQLGLTATPKRQDNADTYKYFGEPIYIYSLKEGINDGFLTPFKVKRIKTTLDDYIYTSDDDLLEGEVEQGKVYKEADFNRIIEIKAREQKRVEIFLSEANPNDKTIIFCANQEHAAAVRDLINQLSPSKDTHYCVRVTANDGAAGEQQLKYFQDNEKTIPTILTTSQKLSTGVDAKNVRNIVLMRPVNSMIEFKQIVGRGTRTFEGKDYFTIYDYVDAHHHFADPEWDGEPEEPEERQPAMPKDSKEGGLDILEDGGTEYQTPKRIRIKLSDGKVREIQHMISTSFWSVDGKPISAEEFLQNLFGSLPEFFKSEEELRKIWGNPQTRRSLLENLEVAGFGKEQLQALQKLINAERSDLFDVLEYVFNSEVKPLTRQERVDAAQATIFALVDEKQREFIAFVLEKYIESGVDELDDKKLPDLLKTKYQSIPDAIAVLGDAAKVRELFIDFQQHLYRGVVA